MALTLVFDGEYDLAGQRGFKQRLAAAETEPEVVLDFTKVSYVDSACVTELLLFARTRREHGLPPQTILVNAGPVAKVFDVTGLSKVCRVVTQSP